MTRERDDLLALFDFAHARLTARLAGLTEDEWGWLPTDDGRIGLRWRLDHLVETVSDGRNAEWLGLLSEPPRLVPATSAAAALAALETGHRWWREVLSQTDDMSLAEPVGRIGGGYAGMTRRAFVHHIADELIHHGAEVGLLRDLYQRPGR